MEIDIQQIYSLAKVRIVVEYLSNSRFRRINKIRNGAMEMRTKSSSLSSFLRCIMMSNNYGGEKMFETVEQIVSIAACVAAALSAAAGFIASLAKSFKNKKLARIAEATNDIADLAMEKVVETEKLFSKSAQILKATGVDTGEIKKEQVMNYIQLKCVEKGLKFDSAKWSEQGENLIKVMNANKK